MIDHSPRSATSVDMHVGSRIRLRRQLLKMSQEALGNELGVTFQQVQKYERGANRVGASRLYSLSRVLDVPVSYFFEGLDAEPSGRSDGTDDRSVIQDLIQSHDGVALAQAFSQIETPKVRRRVIELVRSLSSEEE
ncbi:helix-turn-helix domain-containing protein [Hyphobacterium sp.]|uniref:helix-turn-helix domain-containing protein n=1 Tax=Hyphobacterium sp. TaxID=2004662 RepID=UPI003BAD30B0